MTQTPAPESFLLHWRDDTLAVTLTVDPPRKGRAAFRTNLGHGDVRRREIVAVKRLVNEIDPTAFFIVCDAREVLGEGFSEYKTDGL